MFLSTNCRVYCNFYEPSASVFSELIVDVLDHCVTTSSYAPDERSHTELFSSTLARKDVFQDRGDLYDNLREIAFGEQSHVDFISKTLGYEAVTTCTYCFPSTDPTSFVALAFVLEGVGLGAASAIVSKGYLTYAGSILTAEARYNACIRSAQKQLPFAEPFDIPLDFNEVYSLIASFITSCPASNKRKPQVALKPFPALALSTNTNKNTYGQFHD
ncbi:ferritin-like domain-containing protein [Calycina marina]|uniref:Ferritin-like domain-containing protein n=1 Tax=Calycina marina TaxID=1763456 RepID=A0A9P7Z598_9HELO|nr:ferritin-like domain-containing protein [Calycina marina]